MTLDNALEVSMEQRETSSKQPKDSMVDQWTAISTEIASEQGVESDRESQSGGSGYNETASNEGERVKVGVVATLVGISYDFGLSTVMRTRIGSLESYDRYFPKGHNQPPGSESVLNPQLDQAVVFEDFFAASIRMMLNSVLVEILRKFQVQLHKLTLNAIIQIGKFI
jgi:hypothetical protein